MAADLLLWDRVLEQMPAAKPPSLLLSGLSCLCLTLTLTFQCEEHAFTSLLQVTLLPISLVLIVLGRKLALRKPTRWQQVVLLDQCISAVFTTPALLFILLHALALTDPFYCYLSLLSVSTPSLLATWEHRNLGLSPETSYTLLACLAELALAVTWMCGSVVSGSAVALGLATLSAWTLPAMMARVMSFTQSLRPLKELFPALMVLIVMSFYALLGEGQESTWVILVSSASVLGTTEVKLLREQAWPTFGLLIYSGLALNTYLLGPLAGDIYWWGVAAQIGEELYCLIRVVKEAH